MRITRRMLRQYKRGSTEHEEIINLVPFIDILTILVIYLLVGAVSPHLAALDLNLPSSAMMSETPKQPPLQLTVALRKDGFTVNDRSGQARSVPRTAKGYNLSQLGAVLAQIKQKYPNETSVTLLLEPDTAYDLLVQVMDTARLTPARKQSEVAQEMFPDISIGDAAK